ncbi:MAG TPA: DNA ligase D [Candidatus Acidoferrum sp.]|nr:DNA ligase D [Candidatus Acidoferrum sp.]
MADKLEEYRRKRQFNRTPEPPGAIEEPAKPAASSKRLPKPKLSILEGPANSGLATENVFVVQKHSATRLHYDFRLAIDGTLKSWAVPKGPSLNTSDKRLAVRTEDHPLEYGGFEGKIPEGSYGAGTVMVWDRGSFLVEGNLDAEAQLKKGDFKFILNGEKLRGSFVLVKIKHSEKGNEWLLIKHKDAAEDTDYQIDAHDGSVLTGRTLEEIKQELPPKRSPSVIQPADLHPVHRAARPGRIEPMLATLAGQPFSDPNWLFEIKWDGIRALATIADGALTLRSRNNVDITSRYPELAPLGKQFAASDAVIDGEIVALDEHGHSSFERLQERMHVRAPGEKLIASTPVVYFAFDLLYCDGFDLREAPLLQRKQLLQRLLFPSTTVRFADHQLEKGRELFELARQHSLEGIVAKRIDSIYVSDRSSSWLKLKVTQDVDAVVGGWTAPRTTGLKFGSLLLGLYDGKKLRFIGHVGTGFDGAKQKEIFAQLQKLASSTCPFEEKPAANEKPSWVSPALVARVKFSGWTNDHALRHPVFLGLREDIAPTDCTWQSEVAEAAPTPQPHVVHAPQVVGKVVTGKSQIESELFSGRSETLNIELDGKRLRFSNLNKIYFPESGYTKRDLLAYYYSVADYILPFLKDRALVLRRYPDGIKGQAFFQKDLREGIPDWFKTFPIDSEERGKEIHYATAPDRASLLFLASLGCIDHNPWSSRVDNLAHPDYFFFDLDPSDGTEFSVVVAVAKALHEKLEALKLKHFLKTSGATGFHIFIPVEPVYTYEQLRTFAEIIARGVTAENPNLVTSERIVAKRPAGRVLIDVAQNAEGRPLAAAYSVRAFPKAPVSAPLQPRELRASLKPESFNIESIRARLKGKGDLWADFWDSRQRLEHAIEILSSQMSFPTRKR